MFVKWIFVQGKPLRFALSCSQLTTCHIAENMRWFGGAFEVSNPQLGVWGTDQSTLAILRLYFYWSNIKYSRGLLRYNTSLSLSESVSLSSLLMSASLSHVARRTPTSTLSTSHTPCAKLHPSQHSLRHVRLYYLHIKFYSPADYVALSPTLFPWYLCLMNFTIIVLISIINYLN